MARLERQSLSKHELLKVLSTAREHSTRDWALLTVIYSHGLRASEAAALKLSDIKNDQLHVARLKGSRETTQPIFTVRGKRIVSESAALKEWLAVRPQYPGNDFLFPSQKGGALTREQVYRIYRGHAEAAGLDESKRPVHCLKHSRCSHLLQDGVPVTSVQVVVGHKSLSSTIQYLHGNEAQAFDQVNRAMAMSF